MRFKPFTLKASNTGSSVTVSVWKLYCNRMIDLSIEKQCTSTSTGWQWCPGGSAQGISLMDVYPFKHLSLKNSWCHISSAWEINLLACVSNIVNKSSTFKRQEADFIGPTTVVHLNRPEGRKDVNYYQHVSYWYHEPSWQTFSCNTSASRQTRQTNIYFQLMTQIWRATNSAKDVMFSPVCWSVGMSAGLHKTYRTDFHKTWVLAQNRPH